MLYTSDSIGHIYYTPVRALILLFLSLTRVHRLEHVLTSPGKHAPPALPKPRGILELVCSASSTACQALK